jgi:hypothetical protein
MECNGWCFFSFGHTCKHSQGRKGAKAPLKEWRNELTKCVDLKARMTHVRETKKRVTIV